MSTAREVAEAFSGHRFAEAYASLAEDVRWVLPGQGVLIGREKVRRACEATAAELAEGSTEFLRFLTVEGLETVAVDVIARYVDADGGTTLVSSCDLYELAGGEVVRVTSYAVELEADTLASVLST
jgi:ketosteroid isomerase-like protein